MKGLSLQNVRTFEERLGRRIGRRKECEESGEMDKHTRNRRGKEVER